MPAIARAYVEILPETRKFSDLVGAAIRQLQDPVITPTADISKIRADLDALMTTLDAPPITPTVDPTAAKEALDELAADIDPKVLPAPDVTAATEALAGLAQEIDPNVVAQPDVTAARNALAELERPVEVKFVGVPDFAAVRAEIDALSQQVSVPVAGAGSPAPAAGGKGGGAGGSAASGLIGGLTAAAPELAVGASAAIFAKESITNAQDFLVQLRLAKIEMGLTDDQTKILRQSMIDLGNDQVLGAMSAGDAAVAYRELGKATSLTFDQLRQTAKPALEFAIIAQQDAATGAQTYGQALNALKVPAADSLKFLNELVAADQLAVGSMGDLGESLFRAAPQFTQVFGPGQRQQLQASLVALSQYGVVGPKAGYALAQMSQDFAGGNTTLAKAEETLTAAAKERGVAIEKGGTIFKDAHGNMLPYQAILENLNGALKDRSAADYAKLTAGLSDETKRALPALLSNTDAIKKNAAAIEDAGKKQQLADQKAKAYAKTTDAIGGAWETVTILFGEKVLPVFDKLGGVVATAFSDIATSIDKVDFGKVGAEIEKVTGIDFGDFKAKAKDAFSGLGDALKGIDFKGIGRDIASILPDNFGAKAEQILGSVKGMFSSAFAEIQAVVETVVKVVEDLWDRFGHTLMDRAKGFLDGVIQVINGAFTVVKGIFDVITGVLHGDWSKLWEGIKEIVRGAWSIISGIIDAGVAAIQAVIGVALGTISAAWSTAWHALHTLLVTVWGKIEAAVTTGISTVVGFLGELAGKAIRAVGNLASTLLQAGKDLIDGFYRGVQEIWKTVTTWLAGLAKAAVSAVGSLASTLLSVGRGLIQGLWDGAKEKWEAFNTWLKSLPGKVGDALSSIPGKVASFLNPASHFAQGGVVLTQTFAEIGEDGPEVVIPLTKPGRIRELLREPLVSSALGSAMDLGDNTSTATTSGTGGITVNFDTGWVTKLVDALVRLTDAITALTAKMVTQVGAAVDKITTEAGKSFSETQNTIVTAMATVSKNFDETQTAITTTIGKSFDETQTAIAGVVRTTGRSFDETQATIAAVTTKIGKSFDQTQATIADLVSRLTTRTATGKGFDETQGGGVTVSVTVPTAEHARVYARATAAELFNRAKASGAFA